MRLKFLFLFLVFIMFSCSTEKTLWYGSNSYDEAIHVFGSQYKELKGKKVIYNESYRGNFTIYYTPSKIDFDRVQVPKVICYTARLDEKDETKHESLDGVMKCSFYTENYYFSSDYSYIYKLNSGKNTPALKEAIFDWYRKREGLNFFNLNVGKYKSELQMDAYENGCLKTYRLINSNMVLIDGIVLCS